MKEQTRKEMQRKMADCPMSAPEVSWVDIERAVSASGAASGPGVVPLRRRWMTAAAVVALLVAGGAGLRMLHRQEPAERIAAVPEKTEIREQVAMAETLARPEGTAASVDRPAGGRSAAGVVPEIASPARPSEAVGEPRQPADNSPAPGDVSGPVSGDVSGTAPAGENRKRPASAPDPAAPAAEVWPRSVYPSSVSRSRLTAQVFLGNSMNGYTATSNLTPVLMSAPPYGLYDEEMAGGDVSPLRGGMSELAADIRHYRPVRFGLTFRYGIGGRWSVESGLVYNRQKSDLTTRSGSLAVTSEQYLNYIGIPLNLGFRIWNAGGFRFYASVGAMAEKMVKGFRTVPSAADGESEKGREEVRIRPLQFSLTGAVGAEYRVGRSLGLYAEPGLTYRFDNGSGVPSLYRDEPLDISVNVGLRFSFD